MFLCPETGKIGATMSPQTVFKYLHFMSRGERKRLPGLIPLSPRPMPCWCLHGCAPWFGYPGQMLVGRRAPLLTAAAQRWESCLIPLNCVITHSNMCNQTPGRRRPPPPCLVCEIITGLSPLPNEAVINPNCSKCNWLILGD